MQSKLLIFNDPLIIIVESVVKQEKEDRLNDKKAQETLKMPLLRKCHDALELGNQASF